MSRLYGEIKKKNHMIFFELLPFEVLKFDVAILQMHFSKSIKAKDLKPVLAGKE